ncbi:MAG: carboxylesterase family protein [Bacteroidetes bacterium]|nr:carboxylesterase family protein [Bacteroidota bacterium]
MPSQPHPLVKTSLGQIQGSWSKKDSIAVFKSIPYAKPPIGDLRWRPPQPVEKWDGILKATKYGAMAWQRMADFKTFIRALIDGQGWNGLRTWLIKNLMLIAPTPKESEDCLHLTVRTPSLDPEAKLPVMVWIHGGDHHDGSSFDPFYNGNEIPKRDIVLVSINYRLGLFGYFMHPELLGESPDGVCGNYGLMDQIAALQWVKEHISAFGGDPDNVTVFGQSAGGESVAHLMTSPLAKGLFHKAIMQSPANSGQMYHLFEPFLDYPSGLELGKQFSVKLGISGENQIGQLRNIPAKKLQKIATQEKKLGCFYPVIDGKILPQSPFAAFYEGNQTQIPMIIGSTGNEASLLHAVFPTPLIEFRYRDFPENQMPEFVREAFGEDIDKLLELYPGLEVRDRKAEQDLLGDTMFGAKTRFYAECAEKSGQSAFLYLFNRVPPSPKQTAGAFHGSDLSFTHGTNTPILPLNKADLKLSKTLITFWTNFARTGQPGKAEGQSWTEFSHENPQWMVFENAFLGMEEVSREEKYKLLNRLTVRYIEMMQNIKSHQEKAFI